MSDCSSLENLLAAIDQAIAEHGIAESIGYINYWRKQTEQYDRQTEAINRQIDSLIKERARNNGGLTRGVRG